MKKLKNRRNKEWKRRNGDDNSKQYTRAATEFNELNEKRYNQYLNDIQNQFQSNPSLFWKFAREKTSSGSYPSTMSFETATANTTQSIANLFANCFQTFYRSDDTDIELNSILADCTSDSS